MFLGFVNFYRRFIKDYSHIARPLFDLTKANTKWRWGPVKADAFQGLKDATMSAPVLASPDDSAPFQVEADSSVRATDSVREDPMSERRRAFGRRESSGL